MPTVRRGLSIPSAIVFALPGFFLPAMLLDLPPFESNRSVTGSSAEAARTPSPYIGSVMALLATFEDSGILPPEGTPQANGVIKAVIQFQSAFLKSRHPAVQEFFAQAHRVKFGSRAAEVEASFLQGGWSAESFGAVIEAGQTDSVWSAGGLVEALKEFNVGKSDFDLLAQLYRRSIDALASRGQTFQEVYAQRRQEMPGAKSE